MSIFDILSLIGGLSLFLFGMNVMGDALERRAGGSLKTLLGKLTGNKLAGLLTGMGITAVIQSSSATTVMVVGFVNSGLMTLRQAINVIMGANIGTTVTAWILSLGGIDDGNLFVQMLKPSSFTPILALLGIVFIMFSKNAKKKDTGTILLGFAVLMFGMEAMTDSVAGLAELEGFRQLFVLFSNPLLGVLAGAVLTAIIQSSSASVGILQALAKTGAVSYGAAIPIVMGQNIGTCITAILSSFGTNRNAKRAALVHLSFNVIGTAVWLTAFAVVDLVWAPVLFGEAATLHGIAICHSAFNIACTLLLLPMSSLLEKLAYKLVPEQETPDRINRLDERLLATPAVALSRCRDMTCEMATCSADALHQGIACLDGYTEEAGAEIRDAEEKTDSYEDSIGSYLVKLTAAKPGDRESEEAAKLLKIIGDLERISDHAVDLAEAGEELRDKQLSFSPEAKAELRLLTDAVTESVALTCTALAENNLQAAMEVQSLEEVVDRLRERLRHNHVLRLSKGNCSIEQGFVWADILIGLERISDHCANIAGCILESPGDSIALHRFHRTLKEDNSALEEARRTYEEKYLSEL